MDTAKLKKFAPLARRSLIDQVATKLGRVLLEDSPERRERPDAVARLETEIASRSEAAVIDQVAYTWFNRFCALRFMDVHRYTPLGTVSPADGATLPEILMDAKEGVIDKKWDVDREQVMSLLDGTLPAKDPQAEAYTRLLIAVCNYYHDMMPFLFERISDYTELLIPEDLLSERSILAAMREALTPEACESVEVIGWLYQFYISDKKDEVIGKVVKSEDIPAATQLFTPNWIVKYMVQNSLGAQWLATYPDSPIKAQLEFYIEPAEQTDEVNAQLATITPEHLEPEKLTLIDPACGSGHILVEAYDLFKAIYLERGYQQKDVPQLILEKNLFGLDIDERAAQLTGLALMMKGRADDRRLLERGVKLNVMAMMDSAELDAEGLANAVELADYGLELGNLTDLKRVFEYATTFGTLIHIPEGLAEKLVAIKKLSETRSEDLYLAGAIKQLRPLAQQTELLAERYDAVVANPPYMGSGLMDGQVKKFAKQNFPNAKSDLFACFMERSYSLAKTAGYTSMVTMQSWMFLSSFQEMRETLLREKTIRTMSHIGFNSFPSLNSKIALATAFSLTNCKISRYDGTYIDLNSAPHSADKQGVFLAQEPADRFRVSTEDFRKIPGCPVAYWASEAVRQVFASFPRLDSFASPRKGMVTADNTRFIRCWHEVSESKTCRSSNTREEAAASHSKWFPYAKGGPFRRWAGNYDHVVNWERDGHELLNMKEEGYKVGSTNHNFEFIFKPAISWTKICIDSAFRVSPKGFLYDDASGVCPVTAEGYDNLVLALLNSPIMAHLLRALNPTLNLYSGNLCTIPICVDLLEHVDVADCVNQSKVDWNAYERSWDFQSPSILTASSEPRPNLETSYINWTQKNCETIAEMKRLEEKNNQLFIAAYGLADELTPEISLSQITLTVNPAYRYPGTKKNPLTEDQQWIRFRQDTMQELASYTVGCMMGRYSLDKPGLILANQGDTLEDYLFRVSKFTEPLDEAQAMADPDSVVFVEDAVAICSRCGTESAIDKAHFVLAAYEESEPAKGRPLIYCAECVKDQIEHLGFQQALHRFSARQAIDREWCAPETLATFLSTAACFAHRVPLEKDDATFLPDDDNVIPILDEGWFEDDITERFKVFLKTTFGEKCFEENITYLEDGLFPKNREGGKRKTIRDYFLKEFYKHHVKTYKKRPIYWLFSSPKGAFQALIYLHRYRPDTVSVVRDKYLLEFKAKLTAKIDALSEQDTTAAKKEADKLKKKVKELEDYDRDVLFPLAQKRIEIDLDDGVKVNYNKFGMALKKVTGLTGKA